jgi:hypothetical protein
LKSDHKLSGNMFIVLPVVADQATDAGNASDFSIGTTLGENKRLPEVDIRKETIDGLILLRHSRP